MTTGIVVFGHGSRVESANEAVRKVAAELERAASLPVEAGFLELGQPDLEGAVLRLAERGLKRIIVIPYFLTLGTHLERDLPVIAAGISEKYQDLDLQVTPPLDGHPALVQILLDRTKGMLTTTD